MQEMMTLENLLDRIDKESANHFDKIIPVKNIVFQDLETLKICGEPHYLKPIAQQHISNRLGVPASYLKKCPPDIQAMNLNYWLEHEKNEELFFRLDGSSIRQIFTKKFFPVDHFQILERLDQIYNSSTLVQVSLDDNLMLLNIPDENKSFSINGSRMQAGLSLVNSETGCSSLGISFFTMVLVCQNGLISQRHFGSAFRHISKNILNRFPEVMSQLESEFGRQKYNYEISLNTVVGNPSETLERFSKHFQLGKIERDAIDWAWPLEMNPDGNNNMFHIINTFTRSAQFNSLSSFNVFHLQKTAGNILALVK